MGMGHQLGIELRVVANTRQVLARVQENKTKHIETVEKAQEGYQEKAKAILLAALRDLKAGKLKQLNISLPAPVSHERDYDSIITMLTFHTEPTVELGTQEVQNFLEDKWDWTNQFLMTNQMYLK